jgi:hypothetical protein
LEQYELNLTYLATFGVEIHSLIFGEEACEDGGNRVGHISQPWIPEYTYYMSLPLCHLICNPNKLK